MAVIVVIMVIITIIIMIVVVIVHSSVCRHVVLLDFNEIVATGVQSMQPVTTDSHQQQLHKMQFRQYRQMEAEYFSVSCTHILTQVHS